jgi:glyoxylase-like metal-dependent hydrolase (beta-lactamase superfamily II)
MFCFERWGTGMKRREWGTSMKRLCLGSVVLSALVILVVSASAQIKSGVDKLYILNCGDGVAGDISRWSGLDVGKSMEMSENCYLIHHTQGWLLWDTGIADSIAAMPNGLAPSDPQAIHWHVTKTLASQLEMLSVKPADIKYVAISHSHPDHIGNITMFPQSIVLVQKAEYDWPTPFGQKLRAITSQVNKLEGDHDVFGDGSVTLIATPGHTPGHQSLLVKLPKTGAIVLSGDAVHFQSNWDNRRVPSINTDKDKTAASMQHIADVMAKEHAKLWINHDAAQRKTLKLAPAFYD